ncbi:MAG: Ig-like domain-containing protein [Bacteroidia bacterium]|nr:Ig-like domain-containing protein [Bacteroidia bacterium]
MARFVNHLVPMLLLLLYSCASVVSPSGGAKDTEPPKIVKFTPENLSTNFISNTITITFDEYFTLKDPNEQIFASPPLKNQPEYKIKGKSLIINFQDELSENTTYTINFGNSIKDITENNVLGNLNYVFSTGGYIDSLFIKVNVQSALDNKSAENVLVMLYSNSEDSVVFKDKPLYVGKTDKLGGIAINYIKEGDYKLFALDDINGNYIYDLPDEKIAFIDSLITINANSMFTGITTNSFETDSTLVDSLIETKSNKKEALSYNLRLFKEDREKQGILQKIKKNEQKAILIFNKEIKGLDVKIIPDTYHNSFIFDLNKKRDTLTCWLKNTISDSISLIVNSNVNFYDTIGFNFNDFDTIKYYKNLELTLNANNNILKLGNNLLIKSKTPILNYDITTIKVVEDSINQINPAISFVDSTFKSLSIRYNWKPEKRYTFQIADSSISDIYGRCNSLTNYNIQTKSVEAYGNIEILINCKKTTSNYIVQLTDNKGIIVKEKLKFTLPDALTFRYLNPLNYKIKVIQDSNNNSEWDTGDYLKKNQPEKVLIYPSIIELRSNWDIELEFDLDKE